MGRRERRERGSPAKPGSRPSNGVGIVGIHFACEHFGLLFSGVEIQICWLLGRSGGDGRCRLVTPEERGIRHPRARTPLRKVEIFKPSGDFEKGNERRRTGSDTECDVGDRVIAMPSSELL